MLLVEVTSYRDPCHVSEGEVAWHVLGDVSVSPRQRPESMADSHSLFPRPGSSAKGLGPGPAARKPGI